MALSCEPWCWPPEVVDRLTDAEVLRIIEAQAESVRRQTAQPSQAPPDYPPPDYPPPDYPPPDPARKGAAWEYLVSGGMSPADADRLLAGR